jgi:uncharacterized membrane protein
MKKEPVLKSARLSALTDGIFAFAMTLLFLKVNAPKHIVGHDLFSYLVTDVVYNLLIYAGTFIILGSLWIGSYFQQSFLERVSRPYLWIYVIYMMFICVIPFSASLLANYPENPFSIYFFAINLLCISFLQLFTWRGAISFKLISIACTETIRSSITNRILIGPVFYFLGMLIARWSIPLAFVMLIAPLILHIFPGKVDRNVDIR